MKWSLGGMLQAAVTGLISVCVCVFSEAQERPSFILWGIKHSDDSEAEKPPSAAEYTDSVQTQIWCPLTEPEVLRHNTDGDVFLWLHVKPHSEPCVRFLCGTVTSAGRLVVQQRRRYLDASGTSLLNQRPTATSTLSTSVTPTSRDTLLTRKPDASNISLGGGNRLIKMLRTIWVHM